MSESNRLNSFNSKYKAKIKVVVTQNKREID